MDNKKKLYIVEHESIRGAEIRKGFFDETLAKKFSEAIGCGHIREVEICEEIPDKFLYYVIFESGEVVEKGIWTNDKFAGCINIVTPVRISVVTAAPAIWSAERCARNHAIEFIRRNMLNNDLRMDVTYNMQDDSVVEDSKYKTPMPMIRPMREQTLALLEGRHDDADVHGAESVLLFWASPSSKDGIYRFKLSDDRVKDHLKVSIPAVSLSSNMIEIRRADKDEFIGIARRLGFELVESNDDNMICLKRV